jgi:hypothetical protein
MMLITATITWPDDANLYIGALPDDDYEFTTVTGGNGAQIFIDCIICWYQTHGVRAA